MVHFSQPYIDTGLRILIKKPQPWRELKTGMLILSPLKAEVWIIGLVLFVVVSVLLTIIGRYVIDKVLHVFMFVTIIRKTCP